jgi:hypothetical protein
VADYDVAAVALVSPPAQALVTSYRPAVSVRNNGIHDALASGILRIYSAGRLLFTTEIYSAVIPPGETVNAYATDYWTPPALGDYMIIADVSCPLDQVEPNNHLPPTAIEVIPGEPPAPSEVPLHAAQHEEGGADELIADGLHGRLADPQTPLAHKASHQVGGSDVLDVTGLPGVLAEGQPFADHVWKHARGGSDELNVDELRGVLYNLQKPQAHGNEKHAPDMALASDLSSHLNDTHNVHYDADNLQQKREKGDPNGYAELNESALVPLDQLAVVPGGPLIPFDAVRADRSIGPANPVSHHLEHEAGGGDQVNLWTVSHGQVNISGNAPPVTLLEFTMPNAVFQEGMHLVIDCCLEAFLSTQLQAPAFNLLVNGDCQRFLTWLNLQGLKWRGQLRAHVHRQPAPNGMQYALYLIASGPDPEYVPIIVTSLPAATGNVPSTPVTIALTGQVTGDMTDTILSRWATASLISGLQPLS